MIRSLRWRLIVGTTAASLVVYIAAAVVLYGAIRESLLREFDQAVGARLGVLAASVEAKKKGISIEHDQREVPDYAAGQHEEAYILWSADGGVIERSASWPEASWAMPRGLAMGIPEYRFLTLPDGRRARGAFLSFAPPRDEEDERREDPSASRAVAGSARPRVAVTLLAVRNARHFDGRMRGLMWLLGGVFGLTTLLTAGLMAWVVRSGLRPLGALARGIQDIGETELSKRVSVRDAPVEVRPVVERLNELLARVDASFGRERAFTADVAHELRTPLAGLTTALEVCATQRRSAEEYERVVGKCLKVSRGLRGLVENLLTLARADAQQFRPACEAVDMEALLREVWRDFAAQAESRRLRPAWTMPEALEARTDRGLATVLLRNLLDNAVTYADEGGSLRIAGAREEGAVVLRISNSGSQVASADAGRVFDRFWRGDAARNVTGQRCGLGLALCQRIVGLLGGSIAVETASGGEFSVTVRVPAAESQRGGVTAPG